MNDAFLNRFRSLWIRKRRVELGRVAVRMLLFAIIGLGLLATVDYIFELDRVLRTVALGTMLAAVTALTGTAIWRTTRRWNQPTTAAEIEAAFPQLGQSVRTTVQFSAMEAQQFASEGATSSLVAALAMRTHQQALPLTIEDIVPSKQLIMVAAAVVAGFGLLATASGFDWQWRTATRRALLSETPYRLLDVGPGDQVVAEGGGLDIRVSLIGRTNREILLFTRLPDDPNAEWSLRTLNEDNPESTVPAAAESTSAAAAASSLPHASFVARMDRMTKPIEYRVTAGNLSSPTYRVDIRRPVRLAKSEVTLVPPRYTAQPSTTSRDLNISALKGTVATFSVTFDKPVATAALIMTPRQRQGTDGNAPKTLPFALGQPVPTEGQRESTMAGTALLSLDDDCNFHIVAQAEDGTELPANTYRIRVREDQPPQVTFESPAETVEVHTLAELLMRIRAWDDYGLSKAGVVFQVNNEQEVPLIVQNFPIVSAAARELETTGTVSLVTRANLEKILPLEFFELTQKDSVMYFAFAEDNRPDRAQRAETDMRFIDIRPFKRTYQVLDPDPGTAMGMPSGLKSLEELIKRQRYALNRTLQIEKRAVAGQTPDASTLNQLTQFETELAQSTRDTAQGLEARGFDDTELLHQAEAAMLQAVDSLSVAKWENATLQMRDALKALIEQRDRTQEFILKNPSAAQLAALRAFDRQQAQKLRRPKSDTEEAKELIRRLEELISQEDGVVDALMEHADTPQTATPTVDDTEQD